MTARLRMEMIMKESMMRQIKIRFKWYKKYYEVLKAAKKEDDGVEISPLIVKLLNELDNMRKDKYEKEKELKARKQAEKEAKGKVEDDTLDLDVEFLRRGPMIPIEKEIREQLYHGTSHNGEGRWLYLKHRNHMAPDHRYYDPMTVTHDLGWKVEERALPANKEAARQRVIESQFYRRTGVKDETLRNKPPESGLVEINSLS